MKRLLQIGTLLLFMIGVFSVQAGINPVLIDNDVGIEYTDNTEISDDAVLLIVLEIPGQVAASLKYPLVELKSSSIINNPNAVCINAVATLNEKTLNKQFLYKANFNRKEYCKMIPGRTITEGLFRLDIGENTYFKNLV